MVAAVLGLGHVASAQTEIDEDIPQVENLRIVSQVTKGERTKVKIDWEPPADQMFVSGYRVIYKEVPLSPEEIRSRREDVFELLDKGLISRVGAYARLNPGISRVQAGRALDAIEGRADAIDEIRAAREELFDLVDRIDDAHAARLRLMGASLDHGLRLLDQQLAEDVAEGGGY